MDAIFSPLPFRTFVTNEKEEKVTECVTEFLTIENDRRDAVTFQVTPIPIVLKILVRNDSYYACLISSAARCTDLSV